MENIDKYIEKVNEYIKSNPGISEDMIIRYVYLDLGRRFSFNMEFIPFGNSKKRQEIYYRGKFASEADRCLESNIVICNSVSKLLEIVLSNFGINIKTIVDEDDLRKCPHVFNVVTPKDGREKYTIDLQEDMYRIQMRSFTINYGLSLKDNRNVISRYDIEQMDRKLGYVSDCSYYTDEYYYLLKNDVSCMDNFYDKVKFILENIEVFENANMSYIDRQWYHVKFLERFFDKREFDYEYGEGKIRVIDCYKDIKDKRIYVNCIVVEHDGLTSVFIYNKKNYKYQELDVNNFCTAIKNGLVIHKAKIKEVERILRKEKKAQ